MRRLALIATLLAALPAFAIHPDAPSRFGVLRFSARYSESADAQVARTIQDALRAELSRAGFVAFDAGVALDELRGDENGADLYVDVIGSRESETQAGSIGVGTSNIWADLGLLISRVAAEVRVYDGRTLQLVRTYAIDKKSMSIVPVSVGAGHVSSAAAVWVAVPAMRWWQARSAARDVAIDAASKIVADFGPR